MQATIWTLLPPLIAIALALITKEVYLSLLIGIISGCFLYTGFHPLYATETLFEIMGDKMGGNINILLFLTLLGILVAMITQSGASKAYGSYISKIIKSKRGALLATTGLGALIFVDDYFNCLTVGMVMRPITDKYKISRVKLAYIIDATAAPVCIIAPISSWAAAVGSSLPEGSNIDGFSLFLRTIPFNFYAILTLIFLFFIIITGIDFGSMKKFEDNWNETKESYKEEESIGVPSGKGKMHDLVLPILVLIFLCISCMLYTGGILEGVGIKEAFANCDSSLSLVLGSFFTLVFTFVLYLIERVLSFQELCDCFTKGVKAMVPAVMILSLAWTLSGICSESYLNLGGYVGSIVANSGFVMALMPAILFVVALLLSFATGTSWGTFGILIPIAIAIIGMGSENALAIAVAAILAGAVCGDHMSPISDTTILASTGAQCHHINHVSTQIPYALSVASCCFVGYFVCGITQNGWLGLLTGLGCLLIVFILVGNRNKKCKA